jgi:type II secretory pathway pseudopilin PulG
MSIIEILIYVAILAVIGVVLSGYFVAAITAQSEHDRRNDLANSAQNITAAFGQDAARASRLLLPLPGATSSAMQFATPDGGVLYEQSGATLLRISGSTTATLIDQRVRLAQISFDAGAYFEPRLHATSTSVHYHILLEHSLAPGMVRSIDGTLLIGKDAL